MLEEIRKGLGAGYSVNPVSVTRNNGVVSSGYTVIRKGTNIGVNIYTDYIPEEDVVKYVIDKALHIDWEPTKKFGKQLLAKEYIMQNVIPVLINRDYNEAKLESLVHIPYLDLEIIFRVKAGDITDSSMATFLLNNEIQEIAGLTIAEIYESAMKNLFDDSVAFDLATKLGVESSSDITVLSTGYKQYGASAILNHTLLEEVSQQLGGDLYLIPSSVNEMIAIPMNMAIPEDVNAMLKSINDTDVEEEEILADHIYTYINGRVGEYNEKI